MENNNQNPNTINEEQSDFDKNMNSSENSPSQNFGQQIKPQNISMNAVKLMGTVSVFSSIIRMIKSIFKK